MGEPVLAVDLGGTRMRAAIVTDDGGLTGRRRAPTPRDAECPDALVELAGDVIEAGGVHRAIIGVPGRVNYAAGKLERAPNLPPHWPGALDEANLTGRLGVEASVGNDADLAAVGEAFFGAGAGHEDVVYLTVSTGVGAGVVLGGRLVAGRRSGGELGHTVVDLPATRRGEPATVEELGSGTALERAAADGGLPPDGAALTERVRAGDERAAALWDDLVEVVTVAVVNLAFMFAPQIVVLGGGVGRNGDLLLDPLRSGLREDGPRDLTEPIEVAVAATGDDAGLVGAAAWQTAVGEEPR